MSGASPILARAKLKGAPTTTDAPRSIGPALTMFRKCKTGLDVRILADGLPAHLLPPLAAHVVTRPALHPSDTAQELLRVVGYAALAREIGPQRARGAIERLFPQ